MSVKSAFTSPTKKIENVKDDVLSSIGSQSDDIDTSIEEKNVVNQPRQEKFLAQDLDLMNNIKWSANKMNENKNFDDSSDTEELEDFLEKDNRDNKENRNDKTPKIKLPCHRAKNYKNKTLSDVHSA